MLRNYLLVIAVAGIAVGSCANDATNVGPFAPDPEITRAPAVIALTNVRVVPMTSAHVLDDQTVLVADGRVQAIGPAGQVPVPAGAVVIEGRGRVVAPALIDMHAHLRRRELAQYLRAGVTTVRNMWGHPDIIAITREVAEGTTSGPTVHSLSNGFDANQPRWPYTRLVDNASEADAAVQAAKAEGWQTIKVYQQLSAEVYDSIVQSAKRHGVEFAGHVPTAVPILHALAAGQRSIEHLGGYDQAITRRGGLGTFAWTSVDESRFASLIQRTVEAGTWNCPTLAIYVRLAQQHSPNEQAAIVANRRRFVAELSRSGARLLAGTDAGIDVVAPAAIHEELREFVAAGLTPYQALRAATIDAAEYLRVSGLGTVAVGAPAELLLLDGNPLQDIGQTERIAGIIARGSWYPLRALDSLASRRP
jgi:imidazolonepropionase-like amidohydrolase